LGHLATRIPIGYSAGSARRAATRPARHAADILWTGGLWSCYDPLIVLDAVRRCRDQGTPVTLAFLYARETTDTAPVLEAMRRHIYKLAIDDLVTLCDNPPRHDERDALLKGARAIICLARPGAENQTCVRLRIRDTRLYGLPMIIDPYGPTAMELTRDGRAVALAGTEIEAVTRALTASVRDLGAGAKREPDPTYCYDTTAAPLAAWLEEALAL
jgi:hypothetical protein